MARKKTPSSKSEATETPDVEGKTEDIAAENTGSAQQTETTEELASVAATGEELKDDTTLASEALNQDATVVPEDEVSTSETTTDEADMSDESSGTGEAPADAESVKEESTAEAGDDVSTTSEDRVSETTSDADAGADDPTQATTGKEAGTATDELKAEEEDAIADTADTADTADKNASETTSSQSPPDTKQQSSNPAALIFGGVVAGAIGFAAAYFGLAQQADPTLDNLTTDVASLRDEVSTLAASTEVEPDFGPVLEQIEAVSSRIAEIDGRFETTQNLIDGVNARLDGIESAAVSATLPEGAQDAFAAELEAARAAIAQEREALVDMIAEAQTSEDAANEAAIAATQRAALGEILTALDTGATFEEPLNELALNGAEIPQGLTDTAATGVVPLAVLQQSFPAAAREALSAARTESEGTSGFSGFVRAQLGVRSLAPREGDDPDAVLSRAEAALGNASLADALAEIETLPPEAVSALASWIDDASTRLNAVLAVQDLSDGLN
ncbi:MAG: hypothetical protein AAF922_08065 [Pseudomonadota bacterium]